VTAVLKHPSVKGRHIYVQCIPLSLSNYLKIVNYTSVPIRITQQSCVESVKVMLHVFVVSVIGRSTWQMCSPVKQRFQSVIGCLSVVSESIQVPTQIRDPDHLYFISNCIAALNIFQETHFK
jgi:hypothetical protein